ncbi:MAG: hypothetical protein AseanaTS_00500 [Candidatus Pelagadaptatus aseana]|uniref:hypothetical protein n=1 Tax=Candidatus Pelagadaptatus aseana TaxID=3120508 RepID=UPI0039B306D1
MPLLRTLCALFALSLAAQAHARPMVTFTCPIPSSLPQWQSLTEVFTEAFDRLGYDFAMVYLHTKRELFSHKNTDDYDGLCVRLQSFNQEAADYNLLFINAPVGDPYTSLWRNKASTPATDSGQPITLQPNTQAGFLRGSSLSEKYINSFPAVTAISFLRPDQGLKTLAAGRIDYWIGFGYTSDYLAARLNLGDTIEKVADIRQDFLYPFLNKKHVELKQPLEQEIDRIMAERGTVIR